MGVQGEGHDSLALVNFSSYALGKQTSGYSETAKKSVCGGGWLYEVITEKV